MTSNGPPRPPPGPPSSSAGGVIPPTHSRNTSNSSQNAAQQHRPSVPSALRQTHVAPPSPEDRFHGEQEEAEAHNSRHVPEFENDGIHPYLQDYASVSSDASDTAEVQGEIEEPSKQPTARSRLLDFGHKYHLIHDCGEYNCNHGTLSPRPRYRRGYGSIESNYDGPRASDDDRSQDGYGGTLPDEPANLAEGSYRGDFVQGTLGLAIADGLLGQPSKRSTTRWLAKRHGVTNRRWMYVDLPPFYSHICADSRALGISSTTSPAQTGSGSTASHTSVAISSPL